MKHLKLESFDSFRKRVKNFFTNDVKTEYSKDLNLSKDNEIDPTSITYGTSKKLKFILNRKEYHTTPRNFQRCLRGF